MLYLMIPLGFFLFILPMTWKNFKRLVMVAGFLFFLLTIVVGGWYYRWVIYGAHELQTWSMEHPNYGRATRSTTAPSYRE